MGVLTFLNYSCSELKVQLRSPRDVHNLTVGGRSSCTPGRPFEPILPSSLYLSRLDMGRRQVCHRGVLINLQRLFQSSKNPFGGGSGSEEYIVFCQGGLLVSRASYLVPCLLGQPLNLFSVERGGGRLEQLLV